MIETITEDCEHEILQPEPVQTADEFFNELFQKWRKRSATFVFTNEEGSKDGYVEKHTARMTVKNRTWYLYANEGNDDASKIYERGND